MKEKRNDNAFFKRDFFPNWSKNVARAPPKKAGAATFLLIAFPLFFSFIFAISTLPLGLRRLFSLPWRQGGPRHPLVGIMAAVFLI